MFKIRLAQTDALSSEALRRFEDNAIRHLQTHLSGPTREYSEGDLRSRVRDCIPRSTAYGLESEQQVLCFVDATFLLNDQFDTDADHEWAAKVLTSEKLEAGQKASVLLATAINVYNGSLRSGTDEQ